MKKYIFYDKISIKKLIINVIVVLLLFLVRKKK